MPISLFGAKTKASPKKKAPRPGEAEFIGQELHVNPSPRTSLARLEARKARVEKWLKVKGKNPNKVEKVAYLERELKGLNLKIKLAKGEY